MNALLPRIDATASAVLRNDRNRFLAFAFAWSEILLELDENDRIVFATGAIEALIGRGPDTLLGSRLDDLLAGGKDGRPAAPVAGPDRAGRIDETVLTLRGRDGKPLPLVCSGHRFLELGGHTFLGLRNAARQSSVAENWSRDGETGLLDGRSFVAGVCRQIERAADPSRLRLSLVRVQILGDETQVAGDVEETVLQELASRLREHSSDGDLAACVGPGRFGFVHSADLDLGRLRQDLLAHLPGEAAVRADSIETGSVSLEAGGMRAEEIAKGVVYIINQFRSDADPMAPAVGNSASLADLAREASRTIDGLKAVIASGSYELVFQPIVDTVRGRIHHYEALARFPRGTGLNNTFEHIALAEEVGLINAFDMSMTLRVVEWLRTSAAGKKETCAVNLSGQSVVSAVFAEKLTELLAKNRWLRGRLGFEITESSRIRDLRSANGFVRDLRRLGHLISLDDFGAGAANFSYLANLDVDIVKFDGSAIRSARKTPKGLAFLCAMASVCRDLGISTVFEMVDKVDSLEFARRCGADYVQGYLFGRPHADASIFPSRIPRGLFDTLQSL